ncbi:CHAP domain-containing protein [[Mycobacterium] zoologicum]|nr:CHAP domain-containing protein [Mycolicibacter sp. MYC101]MEB3062230.1 CHAP domain-containing protein [Mycolicibacter sp. MYC101]
MDVDAVEKTSKELKSKANQIKSLISGIDSSVKKLSSTWEGKDAQTFVNDWWPKHKKNLTSVANDVEGLGTSAWNNAQEQRRVSGATGAGSSSQAAHSGTTAAHSAAGTAGAVAGTAAGGAAAASAAASQNAQAVDAFVNKWQHNEINYDQAYGAQCFDVFRQYNADNGIPNTGMAHDSDAAADIYNHFGRNGVEKYYDRIPYGSGTPQPGDVIVYGGNSTNGGAGHVAVITSVDGDNYSVIEQNYTGAKTADGWPHDPALVRPHTFSKQSAPILGYLRPKG